MNIYLDNAFAKVWVDESIPCIFSTIRQPLQESELESISKLMLGCIKKTKVSGQDLFSITNLDKCENLSTQSISDFMNRVVAKEFKSGISLKFFIRPKDSASRNSLLHALISSPNVNISVHDSFQDALKEITRLKTEALQNPKEIPSKTSVYLNHIKTFFKRTAALSE